LDDKVQSPSESGEIRKVARKWCKIGNCFGNCALEVLIPFDARRI
jgi:hypothetical protein